MFYFLPFLLSYQPPGFHHIVFLINIPSLSCHDGWDQLEAFYSIFTTEQQDHVKSVEYLRNNFRPQQSLNNRKVSKSAVKDAWNQDMTDILENPLGTEASKGRLYFRILHLTNRRVFPVYFVIKCCQEQLWATKEIMKVVQAFLVGKCQ